MSTAMFEYSMRDTTLPTNHFLRTPEAFPGYLFNLHPVSLPLNATHQPTAALQPQTRQPGHIRNLTDIPFLMT